ncbi:OsmC family protein [Ureibacillus aquaedulcis]|uniref:OsmC family protein n=1 Tax=Ureibacillus aquaedulcis TaxID=3058421 RepID=A0ABT8GP86_9BACL|nr:OsmC family protein [Ureibacillus sp. BA0131]MDN4493230.1 OsmC family protein [Ureibacillus sp. BA0131]
MANIKTVWNGDVKGNGTIQGSGFETKIEIPVEFGGNGEGAEPKGLLLTSAASCYTMTLVAMIEARKLPVDQYTMDSEISYSKEEGFKIVHHPQMVLAAGATEEQVQLANRAFLAADKACAIGNLLKKADVGIDIEGKVSIASA